MENIVNIKYNNIEGYLNMATEEVHFYNLKYKNICEAIRNVEHDIYIHKKEIQIFNEILEDLEL